MKKAIFLFLMGVAMVSFKASAQVDGPANQVIFKTQAPAADTTDLFDITGTGAAVYMASNTSDGTYNSYKHSERLTLTLVTTPTKPANRKVQLVFYEKGEDMPYAASTVNLVTTIYYPMSMYQGIIQRLEQWLAAKKSVQLKVTKRTTGYTEGVLLFN